MANKRTPVAHTPLPSMETVRKAVEKHRKEASIQHQSTVPPSKRRRSVGKPKRRRFRFLLWMFVLLSVTGGAVTGLSIGLLNRYIDQLDPVTFLEDYKPNMPSRMFAADPPQTMVAEFFSDDLNQNREQVTLEEMPAHLKNAVVAIEDERFFEHCGISPRAFIRAAIHDIKTRSFEQGGSTITMQLVEDLIKNDLYPIGLPEMGLKDIRQKIWEVIIALKIEKQFTKKEILEIYLNQVFLGGNTYGVARAADAYFGKDIQDLTLKECALFAGMLQRPNAYSPLRYPEAAEERTRTVLYVMKREGYITEEEYRQALNEPIQVNTTSQRRAQINLFPYYAEVVRKKFTEERAFKSEDGYPIEIYGRGVDVYTTMDPELQAIAEAALRRGIVSHERIHRKMGGKYWGMPGNRYPNAGSVASLKAGEEYDARIISGFDPESGTVQVTIPRIRGGEGPFSVYINPGKTWLDEFDVLQPDYYIRVAAYEEEGKLKIRLVKNEHVQGALIAVQPSTGKVLAMAGGYNFHQNQFNRATQAKIQPGSAFKPFLYAAAMAKKERPYTPATVIHDVRYEYFRGWIPKNFEDEYFGWVTMRDALAHSYNAASVWLLEHLQSSRTASIQYFKTFCERSLGLTFTERNLSIALGTAVFSPYEIAQAYSVFANEGEYVEIHPVSKIYQRQTEGDDVPKQLYEHKPRFSEHQGVSPQVAYLITHLMRAVVTEGTGQPAMELPFYTVGKTGTTDNSVRGWYTGYTDDLMCVVYMGYDDHSRSLGVKMTGSKTALPVWMNFMDKAYKIHPELFGEMLPPEGIVFAKLHTKTGKLADKDGPGVETFPFIEGTVPEAEESLPALANYQTELRNYISY